MPDIAKIRKAFERLCAGEDDTGCSGGLTVINKCDLEILGGELFAEPQGLNECVAAAVNGLLDKWEAEGKIEKLVGNELPGLADLLDQFAVGVDGRATAEQVSELVREIERE